MSHKNKKYAHAVIPHEVPQKSPKPEAKVTPIHTSRLQSVVSAIKDHSFLIAGVGVVGTAATLLFGTKKGRDIGNRLKDYAVDRGRQGWTSLSAAMFSLTGDEDTEQLEFDEKIHQLQDKFRLAS